MGQYYDILTYSSGPDKKIYTSSTDRRVFVPVVLFSRQKCFLMPLYRFKELKIFTF